MTNITTFSPATNGGFAAGAANFKKAAPQAKGGGVGLLKLRKSDGLWVYGKDDIMIGDAALVVDANAIIMGFVDWKGGKPVGERMAVVGSDPVLEQDLPPAQGMKGWEPQVGMGMIIPADEDVPEDELVIYKTTAQGGIEAFNGIFDAMMARAAASKSFNPRITLSSSSYQHGEYGTIYKPVFTVVGWEGEGVQAVEADTETDDGYDGDVEEADVVEDVKPTRKRRG